MHATSLIALSRTLYTVTISFHWNDKSFKSLRLTDVKAKLVYLEANFPQEKSL